MSDESDRPPKILGLALGVGCLANLIVHIWTTVLAYQMKGFWPAVLTLVLPGLAECYWAYMLWNTMTYYSVIAVTTVVVFGILKFVAKASGGAEE